MRSTYSFGEASPIKFPISDKLAKNYNEAVAEFFKAQQRFNQKFGRRWNPQTDPIRLKWSKKQLRAWNEFARIFDRVTKEQGPFHINDIADDYLVKNTLSAALGVVKSGGRYISTAATLGAVYVVLRGLKRAF